MVRFLNILCVHGCLSLNNLIFILAFTGYCGLQTCYILFGLPLLADRYCGLDLWIWFRIITLASGGWLILRVRSLNLIQNHIYCLCRQIDTAGSISEFYSDYNYCLHAEVRHLIDAAGSIPGFYSDLTFACTLRCDVWSMLQARSLNSIQI